MTIHSKFYDLMPEGYGYVILTVVGSTFVDLWMAMKVVGARKRLGVKYPIMYSDENGGDNEFNCIQRAHQNSLENRPNFIFYMLVSGLQYPRCTIAAGALHSLGRIIYARGYYSGDPEKRRPGGLLFHIADLVLLGGVISFAAFQLGCFK